MASLAVTYREVARISSRQFRYSGVYKAFHSHSQALAETSRTPSAQSSKQVYPLYPSVGQLLHENGIPTSEADKIPTSGPQGRLLKGDVLAYLGTISKSYPSEQTARISKLEHLDLSNIKIASPAPSLASPTLKAEIILPEVESDTEVAVSVSFKAVTELQDRIHNTLGIDMPLEAFINRAIEVANLDLPRSSSANPTTDELFNQVLGLDKIVSTTANGSFTPQIVALPLASPPIRRAPPQRLDIIDILTGKKITSPPPGVKNTPSGAVAGSSSAPATNVFSVSAPRGEEKRARVFLERVKTILQVDPGRLVL